MSPMGPPLGHWRSPAEGGDPNVADEGVTLQGEGMGTQGATTTAYPHTEENVGCLISTLAARLRLGTPRSNTFSGDAMPGKNRGILQQWYHEVQCIKHHYPELVVQENIVRSLKRAAADMASTWALLLV